MFCGLKVQRPHIGGAFIAGTVPPAHPAGLSRRGLFLVIEFRVQQLAQIIERFIGVQTVNVPQI